MTKTEKVLREQIAELETLIDLKDQRIRELGTQDVLPPTYPPLQPAYPISQSNFIHAAPWWEVPYQFRGPTCRDTIEWTSTGTGSGNRLSAFDIIDAVQSIVGTDYLT